MRGGGWASLPGELLEDISGRLSTDADHLHVHQVCAHWRASTSPLAACRPWIVASRGPWRQNSPASTFSMWRLDGTQTVELAAPPGLPHCCGMPRGWLALSDHEESPTRLVLWEPISGAEISLPALPSVLQVFLSDDDPTAPHWAAFASQRIGRTAQKMSLWRPGDASWSLMMPDEPRHYTHSAHSVAFHGRKMYVTTRNHVLVVYDLSAATVVSRRLYLYPQIKPLCRCDEPHGLRAAHVVALKGELLLVVLRLGLAHPSFAQVFRPNLAAQPLELGEKVTDLGGHSLFLGRGDAFALRADDFTWIKRNHVYFVPHDVAFRDYWAVVFDLETNATERIPYPQQHWDDKSYWWSYSWISLRRPFFKSPPTHI